uniref:K Homology domain-containing protein n=1 Tax=Lactuca sativa TaxID=4236 RepID=A0A9R1X2A0_LACSA|nr:hypothetical protein LSAT_V11C700364610 [Lactuca sativa]
MISAISRSGTAIETPKTVIDDEIRATDAIETERAVEAAKEKEVEPLDDHPTVEAKMKEAPEKEAKSVADHLTEVAGAAETTIPYKKLPVDSVIRIIVPVHKVESIFGRNGDLIKKICEETKRVFGSAFLTRKVFLDKSAYLLIVVVKRVF